MYKIIRSILFRFDPEKVHYFSMNWLKVAGKFPLVKRMLKACYSPAVKKPYTLFGLQFPNRVGLGAGFDKNAAYLNELDMLGFGFVEIGTVTPLAQAGNDKPRLFRLPADKALINRMGFNNDGVEQVVQRLKRWKKRRSSLIIGGNIGKNKVTCNENAWKDYEICFKALHPYVDYFVVNVSSPNTPGLRELQEKDALAKILTNLQQINRHLPDPKPILLKIAPDLTKQQVEEVVNLSMEIKLDGLVVSNTTISRDNLCEQSKLQSEQIGSGGLSGMPVQKRSTELIRFISEKTHRQLPIIASGGIFNGKDAIDKLYAGASLVQVWTGFVYEGPSIVKRISNYIIKNKN